MVPPTGFLDHLKREGYHPRSDKHSNALAIAIVDDLLDACPALAGKAGAGEIVYDLNFDLRVRTATWNVDLVFGRPAKPSPPAHGSITRQPPSTVEIAIEFKAVMTEHRKAVKNRKRDLEAHHEHVHNYSATTIAGGVFVINASRVFRSPLRSSGDTIHAQDTRGMISLVQHCLNELRNVSERSDAGGYGLDAKAAIIVEMDNVNLSATTYVDRVPAPQPGDPLNYHSFLQRLCDLYNRLFP